MPSRNTHDLPTAGKLIAFDVGQKTLGIALSDKSRIIASPGKTIIRSKWQQDKKLIQEIITREQVVGAVVGLPLALNGSETPQTQSCLSFADQFARDFGLPVVMWDERLSTAAATNALFEQRTGRQTRASKKDIKAQVDSVAAALFLQSVLDQLRYQ